MDAYWRAANYLSVGEIYLYNNPLLKQPLDLDMIYVCRRGHGGLGMVANTYLEGTYIRTSPKVRRDSDEGIKKLF